MSGIKIGDKDDAIKRSIKDAVLDPTVKGGRVEGAFLARNEHHAEFNRINVDSGLTPQRQTDTNLSK